MDDSKDILARQVRRYRNRLGISQARLAEISGLGPATIKRVETGTGGGNVTTIETLARVFGVRPRDLTEPEPSGWSEVQPLIDAWVEGERLRPRVDPPVTEDEILWLRKLPPVFWEELPLVEGSLESLVKSRRLKEKTRPA